MTKTNSMKTLREGFKNRVKAPRTREAPRNAPVDATAANELVLYIENTSDLSPDGPRGQGRDVLLNALRKYRKGTYDPTLAIKLFGYLVESGAKRYAEDFGSSEREWSTMFPPATRQEAARQLEASFRNSAKQGEYDRVDTGRGAREAQGARESSRDPIDRNRIQSALSIVHRNGRKPEAVRDAILNTGLNDAEIGILLNAINVKRSELGSLTSQVPHKRVRESSRDRDRPISMTYGTLPPFEQFERDIRRPDPDRGRTPYWPSGTLYPMELVDPHEIDMAEDYGLDAFEAERRSTGRNSRVRGFQGDEKQIWGFLEYLSNFGEEDPAAEDLASSIMTTLGYEWI